MTVNLKVGMSPTQLDLLKRLLAVPTCAYHEEGMVNFLVDHVKNRGVARCGKVSVDEHKNVLVVKRNARFAPCVAAHTDTVHNWTKIQIVQQDGILFGVDEHGHRTGLGGDDKAGVFICLELLERFENLAVALFSGEEVGCVGAQNARADFFEQVGYVLEFDAPASGLLSYTSGGVRLFQNDGEFIRVALPILEKHGSTKWQDHPFSDVKALRQRFAFSCLNLSAGYHRWHGADEYVDLAETAAAVEMGQELIQALGERRYEFPVGEPEAAMPPVEVTGLKVDMQPPNLARKLLA